MSISNQHYHLLLSKIHCQNNQDLIIKISEIIKPHSESIATHFYNMMLGNAKANYFINHDIVKQRLHKSLTTWINRSLTYKNTEEMIADYISYQLQIGHIHGRIDLPVSFVNYGMYLIKEKISLILKESLSDFDEMAASLIITNQIRNYSPHKNHS
jgi:diguanylate cyclase